MRKCICIIVTVALVVCVSVSPVGAVDAEGRFDTVFIMTGHPTDHKVSTRLIIPRVGNKVSVGSASYAPSDNSFYFFPTLESLSYVFPESGVYPSGNVGFYMSYAFAYNYPVTEEQMDAAYNAFYSLADTSSYTVPVVVDTFNFSTEDSTRFPTLGQKISLNLSDVDSLTSFSLVNTEHNRVWLNYSSGDTVTQWTYVTSASLIYTESAADLETLESIADQISAGNAIAQAMYADIMEALNAISGDTELMASYINDCLIYLNSIDNKTMNIYNLCASYLHNLADIAQTAEDIEAELESFHTDFMSKLELLISTITSESDDIQATMNSIYQQLIAWLESNFTEAINPELDSTNDDLNQGIANSEAIEQEWTGSLSDNWSAMHIDDFSFDSSFTSGFLWVSAWVTNIYNALGLYGSIIILPLIIGICKLLLGYFRFSGHGHSSGGDDVDA